MSQTTEGLVQAVKQRESNYSIRVNNEWFSAFGTLPCNKGDTVKFNVVINGDYKNIENLEVIAAASTPINREAKEKRIGVSISYAKDLAVAGKIEVEEIEDKTKGFLELFDKLIQEE